MGVSGGAVTPLSRLVLLLLLPFVTYQMFYAADNNGGFGHAFGQAWKAGARNWLPTVGLLLFCFLLGALSQVPLFFTALGLSNTQMQLMYWLILLGSLLGGLTSAAILKPGREEMTHVVALILIATGALMDSQATSLTRPDQMMLSQALIAVPALEVDGERLRGNLELTRGLVLAEAVSIALAQRVGREKAHELVEQCCKQAVAEGRHLRGVLRDSPEVSSRFNDAELDRLLDPANYLGQARRWVERAVAEHHALNE